MLSTVPARFLLDAFDTNAPTVSRVMDDPTEAPRRYFGCSALNGWLYLDRILAIDGSLSLIYWTPEEMNKILDPGRGDHLVHSVEDLEETLHLSTRQPVRMVFVAEGLEGEARRRRKRGSRPG